jgi:hypothetical protein
VYTHAHCCQSKGGKPDNAVGFASECNFAIAKKDHEKLCVMTVYTKEVWDSLPE